MSFRIWAKTIDEGTRYQVYGNNEFPCSILNYLKDNGCEFDEDDCFHDFEIKDINCFMEAMFKAHNEQIKSCFWDLSPERKLVNSVDLVLYCNQRINLGYVFIVFNFAEKFKDIITIDHNHEYPDGYFRYKGNTKIYLSGY